ncbi:MAG: hypothetical protein QQW96_24935 [Tychonema bourrellyi B0820]|uniref:hypothetical protein n=1 Tax=Tychonema bourrellyi TaxID=54313 RepID=UPI000C12DB97|nr:hypothetical protein [Tychonema bourrellyi]MDQ2100880.1 hypothetical protein [Tychonema bourrellyi B0820]
MGIGHREWGIGHRALGIGHWTSVITRYQAEPGNADRSALPGNQLPIGVNLSLKPLVFLAFT